MRSLDRDCLYIQYTAISPRDFSAACNMVLYPQIINPTSVGLFAIFSQFLTACSFKRSTKYLVNTLNSRAVAEHVGSLPSTGAVTGPIQMMLTKFLDA